MIECLSAVSQFCELILLADQEHVLEAQLRHILGQKNQYDSIKQHLAKAVSIQLICRIWFDPVEPFALLFPPEDGRRDAFKPKCKAPLTAKDSAAWTGD